MSQTIKHLRILAFRCGSIPALLKKRADFREQAFKSLDGHRIRIVDGQVSFVPVVHCGREMLR